MKIGFSNSLIGIDNNFNKLGINLGNKTKFRIKNQRSFFYSKCEVMKK